MASRSSTLPAFALLLSLSLPAAPAEAPPPPPDDELPARGPGLDEVGYYESCFGVPRPGMGPFAVYGEVPIPVGGEASGGLPQLSSGSDEKGWLVAAVVAAMALPAVVYVADRPAPRIVLQRFRCPTFALDVFGGSESGNSRAAGFVTTRLSFAVGHVGTDFEYDAAPTAVSAFAAHLLLRPTPKAHVEGGLAIGYRKSVSGVRLQEGLEVGVPHRYALWRDGLRTLGLEIRPLLLVGARLEPSLEAALLVPLADVLHLRAGGKVYTFQGDVSWGLSAGLSLTL